jgi:hypothetical protein
MTSGQLSWIAGDLKFKGKIGVARVIASHLESKFATLQEGVIADAGREAGAESVNGAF